LAFFGGFLFWHFFRQVLFSPPDPDKSGLEFGSEISSFYSRGSPPDPMLKLNGSVPPTPEQVNPDPVDPNDSGSFQLIPK
jgi:hypothetical protein